MTGKRWIGAVIALLATGLLAAGCGGDDDGGEGAPTQEGPAAEETGEAAESGEPLSQDEFAETVIGACERTGDAAEEIEQDLDYTIQSEEDVERLADEWAELMTESYVPLLESLAAELEGITPPARLEADHDSFIGMFRETAEMLETHADVVRDDPSQMLDPESELATRGEELDRRARRLAARLGVRECANALGSGG